MMIFWEAGLVLLAVPKTGTQAVEAALAADADIVIRNPPVQKHMPLRGYRRSIQPLFSDADTRRLETVAVIREPVAWLGSWYRYRSREDIAGTPNSTRDLDFDAFVQGYLAIPQPAFARVGAQSRFVSADGSTCGVDHLFAYERMDAFLAFLEDRLTRSITLPRTNVSPERNLELESKTLSCFKSVYASDFELHARALDA
ncbi:hypothetical protein CLV78_1011086 [Aliiruegeria haliotis]|uniref:Gamma-glutamyl kinase n=1 Tax=Aliiruegeria haliotis TaxID=1280846 RepID=A0A2T0S0Q6_9RHOB|nr:gamma-glutamyl kinase [Aliiruegeria haliotis]PRY26980.1 hypothetical protein CLV78_1011086 [Aliiruegeria haliotis]